MIHAARRLAALLALVLAVLVVVPVGAAAAPSFPKFTGLVVDDAGILPADVKARLTQKLEALQKDTNRQFVVVTIADVQGYPLEDYGYQLGRAWSVGLKDVNNGAILLIAPNNPAGQRGPRLEVGYGLEPVLTDALSSVIINNRMMPLLREGKVPEAMEAGTDAVIEQLRASPDEAKARTDAAVAEFNKAHQRRRSSSGGGFVAFTVIGGMFLLFMGLSFARRGGGGQRYRGDDSGLGSVILWNIAANVAGSMLSGNHDDDDWGGGSGGGWGGGGGGDGRWGGGGFTGGGGGSFGGGGASGSW